MCLFLLVALSLGVAGPRERPTIPIDEDLTVEVEGWIASFPEETEEFTFFELEPGKIQQGGGGVHCPGRLGVYVYGSARESSEDPGLGFGDRIRFTSFLAEPAYYLAPGVEDHRDRLWCRGILRVVRLKSRLQIRNEGIAEFLRPLSPLLRHVQNFRLFLSEGMNPDHQKLVLSVFLGRKRALEEDDRERIRELGIFHLFVVSGFHVSLVVGFLHLVFRNAGLAGLLATIGVLWSYVFLTGAALPTIRAGIMTTVFYLLWNLGLRSQMLNGLGFAGLLLTALWPESVFDPGFQFSFLSLTAIGGFVVPWTRPVNACEKAARACWSDRVSTLRSPVAQRERRIRFAFEEFLEPIRHLVLVPWLLRFTIRVLAYSAQLVVAGLLIQLFAFSLTLHYSNRLIWTQWLSNLLLMPLFGLFVPACFVLFVAHPFPFVGVALFCTRQIANAIESVMSLSLVISWTTFLPQPGVLEVVAYQFLLLGVLLLPGKGRILALPVPPLLLALSLTQSPREAPERLTVTMLDVGQGESIHIEYPDGTNSLVDTGGVRSDSGLIPGDFIGERIVGRYLWSRRCRRLDYVLVTHPHADHVHGLAFLRRAFRIDRVLFFQYDDSYAGLPLEPVQAPSTFSVGEVEHAVLHPRNDEQSASWTTNDASLVTLLTYRNFSILLSGDVERAAERLLAPRLEPVTVLKVPHHGGKASTSALLLERTTPSLAILSAGRNNFFGHPSTEVLARLEKRGIPCLATSAVGSIRIETDGFQWEVSRFDTRSGRFEVVLKGVADRRTDSDSRHEGQH